MRVKTDSVKPELSHAISLGAIEVGLGSVLHAFHVPLSGHFLSLNQNFFLSHNIKIYRDPKNPLVISNLAALLKSLSPAGNRLGPMLSLSAQGLLFSIGTFLFGPNLAGAVFGGVLLGAWAFIQPLITYYFFFGGTLFRAFDQVLAELGKWMPIAHENWVYYLAVFFAIKTIVGLLVTAAAFFAPDQAVQSYLRKLQSLGAENGMKRKRSLFRELTHPFFLASLALTFFFARMSDSRFSHMIWICLRPIALCILVYFFSQTQFVQLRLKKALGPTPSIPE